MEGPREAPRSACSDGRHRPQGRGRRCPPDVHFERRRSASAREELSTGALVTPSDGGNADDRPERGRTAAGVARAPRCPPRRRRGLHRWASGPFDAAETAPATATSRRSSRSRSACTCESTASGRGSLPSPKDPPGEKILGEHPDVRYQWAAIRGGRRYRITGRRGDEAYLSFTVHRGVRGSGFEQAFDSHLNHHDLRDRRRRSLRDRRVARAGRRQLAAHERRRQRDLRPRLPPRPGPRSHRRSTASRRSTRRPRSLRAGGHRSPAPRDGGPRS